MTCFVETDLGVFNIGLITAWRIASTNMSWNSGDGDVLASDLITDNGDDGGGGDDDDDDDNDDELRKD